MTIKNMITNLQELPSSIRRFSHNIHKLQHHQLLLPIWQSSLHCCNQPNPDTPEKKKHTHARIKSAHPNPLRPPLPPSLTHSPNDPKTCSNKQTNKTNQTKPNQHRLSHATQTWILPIDRQIFFEENSRIPPRTNYPTSAAEWNKLINSLSYTHSHTHTKSLPQMKDEETQLQKHMN